MLLILFTRNTFHCEAIYLILAMLLQMEHEKLF